MTETLKLAIAGLGHVGCGVIDLVQRQAEARLPGRVEITGVSARSRARARPVNIDAYDWFDDPVALAESGSADVFVELIGGSDGPAKLAVEAAVASGKHVVTANKALIAAHGEALSNAADAAGVALLFEAAVAGAVPIVRTARDSLSGVAVSRVTGILNGTCNYLTTQMLQTGAAYADVLSDAQRLGYAEADPTLDVSGMDAAHKIAILSAICFNAELDFSKVAVSGVDRVELTDLQMADQLGLRIKLIAEGRRARAGVACSVAPRAIPLDHPLARIDGTLNTVRIEAEALDALMLTGPGAGAGPTASAVMGDVANLFQPDRSHAFGRSSTSELLSFVAPSAEHRSAWFIRVQLADQPGALAALTEALARASVSVDKILQESAEGGAAPVAIVTHPATQAEIDAARAGIEDLDPAVDGPRLMLIEGGSF